MALEEKVMQSILGTNKKQQILHWLKCVRVYVGINMCTYIYTHTHTYQQTHKDFKCSFLWIKTNQQHYIQTQFDPNERYCRKDIENKKKSIPVALTAVGLVVMTGFGGF